MTRGESDIKDFISYRQKASSKKKKISIPPFFTLSSPLNGEAIRHEVLMDLEWGEHIYLAIREESDPLIHFVQAIVRQGEFLGIRVIPTEEMHDKIALIMISLIENVHEEKE